MTVLDYLDACPVDCIHPRKDEADFSQSEHLYIDPAECIDCGACIPNMTRFGNLYLGGSAGKVEELCRDQCGTLFSQITVTTGICARVSREESIYERRSSRNNDKNQRR